MTRAKAMQLRQLIEQLAVTLDDETALTGVELFPAWATGMAYAVGDRVQHGGTLYKCVQEHTALADWPPYATPALWVAVSLDEYPEWAPPTGAQDAYRMGDKVSYNGKHYISTIDANTYAPGVYGWEEVII